jgi:predicted ester cyclase
VVVIDFCEDGGIVKFLGELTMSNEQNKEIVRRFDEAFEAQDEDAKREVLSPELVAHTHGGPGPQTREDMLQGIASWNATFSDTQFIIHEQVAEGNAVMSYMIMKSTHDLGEFQGLPPSGKKIDLDAASLEYIEDGQIVERRIFSDWMVVMQQLGLIPAQQG